MRIRFWVLAIISFIFFQQLIHYFVIQSFNVLSIEGQFPPATKIYFESTNGLHEISQFRQIRSGVVAKNGIQKVNIQLKNRSINRFRLRFEGDTQSIVSHDLVINKISLFSNFSKRPVTWSEKEINGAFTTSFDQTNKNTSLTLKHPPKPSNGFLSWVLPFFLSLCLTLAIAKFEWRKFPAIQDLLSNQQARNTENYGALDGLRGLAAFLVLLEHTIGVFKYTGALGVWMFFVLSGFLLTKPFVVNPSQSVQLSYLGNFMVRRFKRIIPMYFFMITCFFLLRGHYETALRHYLLAQGDGHYWTILQEMYFYLLLPFLTLTVYAVCRGRVWVAAFILLLIAILWEQFGSKDIFAMYAFNQPSRAFFEVFIVGMLGAYIYHGIYQNSIKLKSSANKFPPAFGLVGIFLLCVLIYINSSDNTLFGLSFKVKQYPLINGLLCLLLIFLAITGPANCWYKRLLSNPLLRYIGIIGYSFYLLHPYCIAVVKNGFLHFFAVDPRAISQGGYLLMATLLTLILASFTYSFIERPFLKKAQ